TLQPTPTTPTLFPYTTLFRSELAPLLARHLDVDDGTGRPVGHAHRQTLGRCAAARHVDAPLRAHQDCGHSTAGGPASWVRGFAPAERQRRDLGPHSGVDAGERRRDPVQLVYA